MDVLGSRICRELPLSAAAGAHARMHAGVIDRRLLLMLRSSKGVYKATAVGAWLRLGSSLDPGPAQGRRALVDRATLLHKPGPIQIAVY
jgi:hypothetical protein